MKLFAAPGHKTQTPAEQKIIINDKINTAIIVEEELRP